MQDQTRYAGFWRRFLAYLVDAVPITIIVVLVLGPAIGMPQAYRDYAANRRDSQARAEFLKKRNYVRSVSGLVLLGYGTILEGSPLQTTFGKAMFGMRVTATDGSRLGFWRAFVRNVTKFLSLIPAFLGCIWAAFDRRKQAWHDKIGGCLVLIKPRPVGDPDFLAEEKALWDEPR